MVDFDSWKFINDLFGLFVILNPIFGAMTIILWEAIVFIVTGIFNIALNFMLRKIYP